MSWALVSSILMCAVATFNVVLAYRLRQQYRRAIVYERLLQDLCVRSFLHGKTIPVWDAWASSFGRRYTIVDLDDEEGG